MTPKRPPITEQFFLTRNVSGAIFAGTERGRAERSTRTLEEQVKLFNELSVEELEELVASGEFYELFPITEEELAIKAEPAPWPKHLKSTPYELD